MAQWKIEELNLEDVAKDIVEFYEVESEKYISYDVVLKFLNDWAENKYDLYKKMGNKLIVSSVVEGKDFTSEEDFLEQIKGLKKRRSEKLVPTEMDDFAVRFYTWVEIAKTDWRDLAKNSFGGNIWILESWLSATFNTPAFLNKLSYEDKVSLSNKSKLTKAIAAYFKTEEMIQAIGSELAEKYTHYAVSFVSEIKQICENSIKPAEVFLSIHPYDYVTMSWNTLGWRSCYAPDGEYAKSVFSVMADKSTAIAYSVSSKKPESRHTVVKNNKKVRTMVHFDETLEGFIINTVYPASAGSYEGLVVKAIENNKIILNAERKKDASYHMPADEGDIVVSEAIYDDLPKRSDDPQGLSMYVASDRAHFWYIGVPANICMCCGNYLVDYHDDVAEDSWYCTECDPEYDTDDQYNEDEEEDLRDYNSVEFKGILIPSQIVIWKASFFADLSRSPTEAVRKTHSDFYKKNLSETANYTELDRSTRAIVREYFFLGWEEVEFRGPLTAHASAIYYPNDYIA